MFYDFFNLGIEHILDPNGFDHILFVTVLCALYSISEWKKILVLVTAFTIGHSLTLALAALDIVRIDADLIEMLIPITIILTGVFNIVTVMRNQSSERNVRFNYFLALFFGLIHGLGFSNYFRAIMGKSQEIIKPLFAFNVGVEVGQVVIVSVVLVLGYILMYYLKLPKKYWTIGISIIAILVATWLLLQ